ncbi:LysR family transcriptional regulator [Rhodobacteraceae bacterium M385]|nr:LysR family transcriptional regulator [Rhodobacteraceae bacterium M385]
MTKGLNLNRLAYFAAVVETGSFTHAAERLGITKAVVSQQITNLEQEVKTTLLVRSTRSVSPTEAGHDFYSRCSRILKEAEEAFDKLSQSTEIPTGTLRITAPYDYGATILAPVASAFRQAYPNCRVVLHLGDRISDLISEDLDLAIRVGWLTDSSLQARRIGVFRQIVVASAAYAEQLGALTHPEELRSKADFVGNLALADPLTWSFTHLDGRHAKVRLKSDMMLDTSAALLQAIKADAGVSVLPDFQVQGDLAAGELKVILPEWSLQDGGIYTVYPPARFRPAKVTQFARMLSEREKQREREVFK